MSLFGLLVTGLIILLLLGNRLPSAVRALGRGFIEFKKGLSEIQDDLDDPPTASGVFARIKPRPSGGAAAREPESDEEE